MQNSSPLSSSNNKHTSTWLISSLVLTAIAVIVALIPWPPLALIGGVALLTLLPGMQLIRWLGLWRGRHHAPTLVLSTALGLVVSPLLLFWAGWLFGLSRLGTFSIGILFILLTAWLNSRYPFVPAQGTGIVNPPHEKGKFQIDWFLITILILLTAAIILAYTEGQTELGSYPIQMGDWVKHHGVTWSLRHTGIPPKNVFFSGMAPDDKLSYYYFLHLTIASLDILRGGPANIHLPFVVITIIAALSFATIFYLLAHHLFKDKWAARAALLFATFIGGLDIIPTIRRVMLKQNDTPFPNLLLSSVEHIDNWTPTQQLRLSTFMAHYLWVPQHLTGLLIVALGLYLYQTAPFRRRLLPVLALLIAALLGYSAWIALVIFMMLPLFALYQIGLTWRSEGQTRAGQLLGGYGLVAVGAVILILPFALTLVGNGATQAGIAFEIPHNLSNWPLLSPFSTRFPESKVAQLLDVPLHYLVEMGALLIGGLGGWWLFWRQRRQAPLLPFLSLLLVTGFGLITFFAAGRSFSELGLILNNDLGLRAIMPAQMVLALFAGYHLARISRSGRWQLLIIVPLIVLGLASSLWEVAAMGIAKYNRPPQVPANVLQAFQKLPELTPLFSVVQHRTHDDFSRVQPGYADRFNGYSTSEAISVGMYEPFKLALAIELAQQAFSNSLPLRSYQMFLALGADYVFVGPVEQNADYRPEKFRFPLYFTSLYEQDDVSIFAVRALFTDEARATFDNGAIEFRGHFIDPAPLYPGDSSSPAPAGKPDQPPGLVTAWRLPHPTGKNYTAFIHLVDPAGNIMAQADHQLWAWDVRQEGPTTIWTPDLTHLDIVPIPEPALTAGQPLTIRLGLWLPDTGQHFPVESSSLEVDEAGRLVIGKLSP